MELRLPASDQYDPPITIKKGITFLLTKNDQVFYYTGEFYTAGNAKGVPPTQLKQTTFDRNGLHQILMDENTWANDEINRLKIKFASKTLTEPEYKRLAVEATADSKALTALVKTDDEATYKNAIDMLDELKICNVGKRVLGVDMMEQEYQLLRENVR